MDRTSGTRRIRRDLLEGDRAFFHGKKRYELRATDRQRIAKYVDERGWAGIDSVSGDCGIYHRIAARHLRDLEEAGRISIAKRRPRLYVSHRTYYNRLPDVPLFLAGEPGKIWKFVNKFPGKTGSEIEARFEEDMVNSRTTRDRLSRLVKRGIIERAKTTSGKTVYHVRTTWVGGDLNRPHAPELRRAKSLQMLLHPFKGRIDSAYHLAVDCCAVVSDAFAEQPPPRGLVESQRYQEKLLELMNDGLPRTDFQADFGEELARVVQALQAVLGAISGAVEALDTVLRDSKKTAGIAPVAPKAS